MTKAMATTTPGLLLVTLLIASAPRPVGAYPEPAIASPSWQLDFTFDPPRAIAVKNVDGFHQWYWYLTYKVVNRSGKEQFFLPEITIATDSGEILSAGRGVPPTVFEAIKSVVGNPLLENPYQVAGRILLGEDSAKESVAIWPVSTDDVDELSVFVSGLSGETQVTAHPLTGEPTAMRKTLMLDFATPGTQTSPQNQSIEFKGQRWVMR